MTGMIYPWSLKMCVTRSNHNRKMDLTDPFTKFLPSPRPILGGWSDHLKTREPPGAQDICPSVLQILQKGSGLHTSINLIVIHDTDFWQNLYSDLPPSPNPDMVWENLKVCCFQHESHCYFNCKYKLMTFKSIPRPGPCTELQTLKFNCQMDFST